MPKIRVNGVELYYEDTGQGDEIIVFSHGLLFSTKMYEAQVKVLQVTYRCIAYDHRGQGQSEVASSGYDIETVYEDAVAFIEALDCAPVHFVGLSMGGFVGLRIGIRRPDLLKSLILLETSADEEPQENLPRYNLLKFVARWLSPKLVTSSAAKALFGQNFLDDPSRKTELDFWKKHFGSMDRVGVSKAAGGAFSRRSVYEEVVKINVPTLVVVGDLDTATTPDKSERIHSQIAHSKLVIVPGAGHSSPIEAPELVTNIITDFLNSL